MSDKSSTFAPEIGKDMFNHFIRRNVTGNAGERPERDSRMKNTYRKRADEKSGALPISGSALFTFFDCMIPTYIQLWRIIFDAAKSVVRHICDFLKR